MFYERSLNFLCLFFLVQRFLLIYSRIHAIYVPHAVESFVKSSLVLPLDCQRLLRRHPEHVSTYAYKESFK